MRLQKVASLEPFPEAGYSYGPGSRDPTMCHQPNAVQANTVITLSLSSRQGLRALDHREGVVKQEKRRDLP